MIPNQPLFQPLPPLPRKVRTPAQLSEAVSNYGEAACPLLIKTLGHKSEAMRETARVGLMQLGERGFQALLQTLVKGKRREQEFAALCLGDWKDTRATGPLLEFLERTKGSNGGLIAWGCVAFLFMHVFAFILLPFLLNKSKSRITSRVNAINALGRIGDLRAVSKLASLAHKGKAKEVEWAAQEALKRILPEAAQLLPEQAGVLGTEAIPELCTLLTQEDPLLIHQVLMALKAVGDSRAIPPIQRFAASWRSGGSFQGKDNSAFRPTRHSGRNLQEEANSVLEVLYERAQREQERQTLLRGFSQPGTQPAELLRPVQTNLSQTPMEQLLRPGIQPEGGESL